MTTHQKKFRYDINGLRAIAALSVLIFHFDRSILPGGFVGVDVFFVISGFLMTSIIFRGFESDSFSVLRFYLARARRIVPTLTCIVFITLIVGFLVLEPLSYQFLGRHARDSLFFVSNFTYLRESGYFDTEATKKILLHTWTLSVEWQFYIIYPIVLVVLKRFLATDTLKKVIFLSTLSLLIYCIYQTPKTPEKAYFMLHTRAWEMLLGALVFLYPLHLKWKKTLEAIGIALIITSCFLINQHTLWPSYWALLPTVGACCVIAAQNDRTILSISIIQKLGLWSYSIYLVHWPILAFLKHLGIQGNFFIYFPVVIFLGFLLYQTIEKKRDYKWKFLAFFALTLGCAIFVKQDGVTSRVDPQYRLSAKAYHHEFYGGAGIPSDGKLHHINASENTKIILFGDSMARQYARGLIDRNLNIYSITQGGCMSTKNYYSDLQTQSCAGMYQNFIHTVSEHGDAKYIIYSQFWDSDHYKRYIFKKSNGETIYNPSFSLIINDLAHLVNQISEDQTLILIGAPQGTNINTYECLAKNNIYFNFLYQQTCPQYEPRKQMRANEMLKEFSRQYENVIFIDPNDLFCDQDKCIIRTKINEPIYSDMAHLSTFGANIVNTKIIDEMSQSIN